MPIWMPRNMILMILLFLFPIVLFGESREIDVGTPIFSGPEVSEPILVTSRAVTVESDSRAQARWGIHPLLRNIELYRFHLQTAGDVWYSPDLRFYTNFGVFYAPSTLHGTRLSGAAFLCLGLLLLLGYLRFHRHWTIYPAIVCVTWGVLLYMIGATGNLFFNPMDELSYYAMAQDYLQGDWKGPWLYPVGFPLFYLPFLLILHPESIFDFLPAFSYFNSFVIFPLYLVMVYEILRRMEKKRGAAILTCFLFVLMMTCYVYRYKWFDNTIFQCKGYWHIPGWMELFPAYNRIVWFGYNAASDTSSAMIIMGIILLAMTLKKPLVPVALLFGFACIVRLQNVLFSPLFLFLLFHRYYRPGWSPIRFFLTGALLFLSIVGIQLAVNRMQFGNCFTFSYVLHKNQAAKGFLFEGMSQRIKLLIEANYLYMVSGFTALFFLRKTYFRVFLILLIVPITLFFYGYPETINNGHRFLLPVFPFLLGAFLYVFWNILQALPKRKMLLVILAVALSGVLTAPCEWWDFSLLPFSLHDYRAGAKISIGLLAATLIFFLWTIFLVRKEKRARNFLLLWGLFFFIGSPYPTAALPLPLLFLAGRDCRRLFQFQKQRMLS